MYWKQKLNVPKGIKYLSNWMDFSLQKFQGHNIIHKQLPGCGFTEYVLRCPEPVVLNSPRRMLMENKAEQHGTDVFLVKSKFDRDLNIDEDTTKSTSATSVAKSIEEDKKYLQSIEKDEIKIYPKLFKEIDEYLHRMYNEGKPPKIIVTYDSSYLIRKILESMGILNNFWFIVDEFQSLLDDARFKAETENNFLTVTLQQIPNVTYVSATPMLDKYISRISQLNIPYYELDWGALDPTRIKRPDLKVRTMKSISSRIEEIVQSYLDRNFEKVVVSRGGYFQEIESRECVIYVNSVNHIINTIKKMELTPDQVNILCSKTPENQAKIERKLGKKSGFEIGKVPLRGEPHKMFTFCTRTVYLGADFYSTNARSFIFSDANSDCLSIDISMDLAQILGRQRLEENPWNNSAEFYYKATADYKKMTWEDLKKVIDIKEQSTQNLLSIWEKGTDQEKQELAERYLSLTKSNKYRKDYVAVNRVDDLLIPIKNELVVINEERTFDIQQIDYADRFAVFCKLEEEFGIGLAYHEEDLVSRFFKVYDKTETYVDKIKMICEFLLDSPQLSNLVIDNLSDHDKIKQQLVTLGPERIKGLGYNITKIKEAMGITIFDRKTLDSVIYHNFTIGSRYTKKYIKEVLRSIYKAADFHGTAKATDLENWFEIKTCKVVLEDGTRPDGFEILSIKQQ